MPDNELLKRLASDLTKAEPEPIEIGRLRLYLYPETGVLVVTGYENQPNIYDIGRTISFLRQKGCRITGLHAFPIIANLPKEGAIILFDSPPPPPPPDNQEEPGKNDISWIDEIPI